MNNIKNSFIDICGYISYMSKKLVRFWLVVLILIIACYLVYEVIPKDIANNFFGVIISIIAAVLFEGYRSYKKYKEDTIVMNFCLGDLKKSIERFSYSILLLPFHCDIRVVVNYAYGKIFFHTPPEVKDDYKKNLKLLIRDVTLFDNLEILPEFKVIDGKDVYLKESNIEYEMGLCFYEYLKKYFKENIDPAVDKVFNVIILYCYDVTLLKILLEYRGVVKRFVEDNDFPEIYRRGRLGATYYDVIYILKYTLYVLEKIEEYENNGEVKE